MGGHVTTNLLVTQLGLRGTGMSLYLIPVAALAAGFLDMLYLTPHTNLATSSKLLAMLVSAVAAVFITARILRAILGRKSNSRSKRSSHVPKPATFFQAAPNRSPTSRQHFSRHMLHFSVTAHATSS